MLGKITLSPYDLLTHFGIFPSLSVSYVFSPLLVIPCSVPISWLSLSFAAFPSIFIEQVGGMNFHSFCRFSWFGGLHHHPTPPPPPMSSAQLSTITSSSPWGKLQGPLTTYFWRFLMLICITISQKILSITCSSCRQSCNWIIWVICSHLFRSEDRKCSRSTVHSFNDCSRSFSTVHCARLWASRGEPNRISPPFHINYILEQ